MTFTERFRLQGPAKGCGWREMAAADSREQLEKIRKSLRCPELYRVIDTQKEKGNDR